MGNYKYLYIRNGVMVGSMVELTEAEISEKVKVKSGKKHEHWFDVKGYKYCPICKSDFDIPVIGRFI